MASGVFPFLPKPERCFWGKELITRLIFQLPSQEILVVRTLKKNRRCLKNTNLDGVAEATASTMFIPLFIAHGGSSLSILLVEIFDEPALSS